jgi:hypothetical protein
MKDIEHAALFAGRGRAVGDGALEHRKRGVSDREFLATSVISPAATDGQPPLRYGRCVTLIASPEA